MSGLLEKVRQAIAIGQWSTELASQHPDLAAHDALGLATQAELNTNLTADPTTDQKAALAGTSGVPSVTNKYVTDADARNTNARTPSSTLTHGDAAHNALTYEASGAVSTHAAVSAASTHGNLGHSNANDHANTLDHAKLHTVTDALAHTFPGGGTTYLRDDGTFQAVTASVTDPNPQSYTPGTFTLATEKYIITSRRIQLTGVQRITLAGTARWRHT